MLLAQLPGQFSHSAAHCNRAGCPKSRRFSRDLLASGVLRERRRESGRWSSCWFTHRTRLSASCCCTLCSFYRLRAPWGGGAKSCNSSARVVIFRKLFDRTQHTFISLSCVLRLGSLDLVGCNSPSPYLSGKANASRASEAFSGLSSVPNNPLPPAAITTNCL